MIMTNHDLISEIFTALSANKVRSGLTMLGIIIGISSVIVMVSIGQGAQSSITDRIQSIGSNLLTVSPGAQGGAGQQISSGRGSAKSLTIDDVEVIIKYLPEAELVTGVVSGRYQITAKGTNTNTTVVGTDYNYATIRNLSVAEGEFLNDQHNRSLSRVTVIGPTVVGDLFGEGAEVVGEKIRINNVIFTVIGVTEEKGGDGFNNQDDQIFIPLLVAKRFLSGDKYLSSIYVQAADGEKMDQLEADITDLLLVEHKISNLDDADFSIANQSDILETASSVTDTFTVLLAAVASISLVVGGIGIMNMMLTTVTERTREIGLRKAIGARGRDINRQFLFEAVSLTGIGGGIGILIGWTVALMVSWLGIITTSVSLSSVILAFGVSALIGIVFGYYPARRAAALNPIEALRYE